MKKTIFSFFVTLLLCISANGKDISDYFVDMPSVLMPTLGSSYRVELVENFQKSGKDSVQNMFGTQVKILSLDTVSQNILVQATKSSRFEMQLLQQNNDTVIGIINTVCAPICSSYIKFYDTEWNEMKQDLPKFDIGSWVRLSNSGEKKRLVENLVKVNFVAYSFNANKQTVEVRNNSLEYLNEENRALVAPLIDEKYFVLRWSDENKKWVVE